MKFFTSLMFLLLVAANAYSAEWKQIMPEKTIAYAMTQNSSRVFISTYDQGVFVADNGSAFFESKNSGLSGIAATRMAAFGNVVFFISEGGLYMSENNGDSWTLIYDNMTTDVFYYNGTIFIASMPMKFSKDKGASWEEKAIGSAAVTAFTSIGSTIYTACSDNSIYTSNDGGSNWTKSTLKPAKNISRMVSNSNSIAGLYIDGSTFIAKDLASITSAKIEKCMDVFVSNNDFYCIGASGLYRMASGFNTYSKVNSSIVYPGYSAAVVNNTVYYGTSDDDTWWFKLDNPQATLCGNGLQDQNIMTINSDSKSNLYIGASEGIFKSTDKGKSFKKLYVGSSTPLTNCNIIKTYNDNIVASFISQAVYFSTDQGQDWQKIPTLSTPLFTDEIVDFAYTPTSILIASGKNVKKYNLAGIFVEEFGESYSSDVINAIATKNEDVYIATKNGIKAYVDGAWISGPGLMCKSIVIADDGTVYGAGYDQNIAVKKPQQMFELIQAANKINIESLELVNNVLVAATASGVYFFQTSTNSWRPMNDGLFNTRLKKVHKSSNTLFTAGIGFAYMDVSSGVNDVEIKALDKNELSINPNPASNYFNIDLNSEVNDFADINFFDINGNKVFALDRIEISNGKLLSNIRLDNLSAGSYFILVKTLNKVYSTSIIINK